MAGHSKWANIKRHKSVVDAKRGKIFTKLIKEITVSARMGGGDPNANPRLRLAIEKAKSVSMPKDNIDRAVKKGTGELAGGSIDEIIYEGFGPGGIAIIVVSTTDNKNRTVSEIRLAFTKNGGNLGETGSVSWMFDKMGVIRVDDQSIAEEDLFEKASEAGASDILHEDKQFLIYTVFENHATVLDALQKHQIPISESAIEMVAKNTIAINDKEQAEKLIALIDTLEDNDDVQDVWANFAINDELLG